MTPAQQYKALKPAKRSKYGSRKVIVDGIKFDSATEARKYGELNLRVAAGEITGFDRQVPFDLIVNGEIVCRYIADFLLYLPDGSQQVIDVKGLKRGRAWDVFRLKVKLMKAILDIDVIVES